LQNAETGVVKSANRANMALADQVPEDALDLLPRWWEKGKPNACICEHGDVPDESDRAYAEYFNRPIRLVFIRTLANPACRYPHITNSYLSPIDKPPP